MKSVENAEIVIIRRPSELDRDDHKGGVWKIAFADFMTAMMAFFLVMWLINVTSEETRAGIASYFNPVKLAEATVDRKGLRDPVESEKDGVPEGEKNRSAIESDDDSLKGYSRTRNDTHEREPQFSESALFEDPYAVLAALVTGTDPAQSEEASGAFETLGQAGAPGLNGGDAQRDPFDPVYWRMSKTPLPHEGPESGGADSAGGPEAGVPSPTVKSKDGAPAEPGDAAPTTVNLAAAPPAETKEPKDPAAPALAASEAPPPAGAANAPPPAPAQAQQADAAKPDAPASPPLQMAAKTTEAATSQSEAANSAAAATPGQDAAQKLQAEIAQAISHLSPTPGVEVRSTDEGLLVSIMENSDFGMFAVGSAEPVPQLIRTIDNIAVVLRERPGDIVVRGHTDGRPFRSKDYDNWRLSTARAHMAYYMLVRGGIPESRFERIEGYADQKLKLPQDPEAPQNRRIEVLIRENAQ